MKILVAEDDRSVCEMLSLFLTKHQFQPVFIHDGIHAMQAVIRESFDFIVLDWMLPGKDGIELCKEIRQSSNIPIILLTAMDAETDRILGLESGADDYITKPFSPMELIARIKAVMRRYKGTETDDSFIRFKNININANTREVSISGTPQHHLTPKEFELLSLFVKHPKKVFTREQLLESIWGYDYFGDERTVDVHIKRLRNKISTPQQS
ncbi:MAG: DNA-binding response regulator, partial [Paenibacillus sp. RIFOXYA1_FULL_44_5]